MVAGSGGGGGSGGGDGSGGGWGQGWRRGKMTIGPEPRKMTTAGKSDGWRFGARGRTDHAAQKNREGPSTGSSGEEKIRKRIAGEGSVKLEFWGC